MAPESFRTKKSGRLVVEKHYQRLQNATKSYVSSLVCKIMDVDVNNNVVIEDKWDESQKYCLPGENSQQCLRNEDSYPYDASKSEESEGSDSWET